LRKKRSGSDSFLGRSRFARYALTTRRLFGTADDEARYRVVEV
jgi:hypothetical protein